MIDLHVHTIFSDGEYSPIDILKICKANGILTLAITDHNSLDGSKRAILSNPYKDISIIPGVELSAIYPVNGANLHILGYNIDLNNETLNSVTKEVMKDNITRLESLIYLLKEHYDLTFKQIDIDNVFNSIGNIGKTDIAKLCVKYNYAPTIDFAFDNFFNPIEAQIAKRKTVLTDLSCIEYIRGAGGIPCLAHPITLKKDLAKLKKYIATLIPYGLEAIEVYHSIHSQEYSNELLKIVNEYGLLYSVGSDFHGPLVSPDIELGYGKKHNLCKNNATILSEIVR